ncbi:hypothetical protein KSP40_PGU014326 [Platanthera guangdongensis]|uniref:Uncharacterized protein n=1 Tax=Platanthera guangdongensis TaxID=2320717 RepID=A0ABR2LN69_9ASPA
MEIAPAARQFFVRQLRIPLFAARSLSFASGSSSSSSTPARRRYPPPPPHEFSNPCEFLGSWKPVENPREAETRLDRLRKDYAKQVSQLRKEYAHEMSILSAEKQRKKEAKREAIRLANEERKVAKSTAAVALAAQRKAFQEEFRQTLLKEKAEKLECWRKKEQLLEQKKVEKKELLRRQSSLWISEEKLESSISDAIIATTPL